MMDRFEGDHVSFGTGSMLRAYELASARFSEGAARYFRLRTQPGGNADEVEKHLACPQPRGRRADRARLAIANARSRADH
jgi:hypothetical protein